MPSSTTVLLAALAARGSKRRRARAKPIRALRSSLIVPVPAGGVTDTMARIVAQRLTEAWGQPVVVDKPSGRQLWPSERKRWRNRRRTG